MKKLVLLLIAFILVGGFCFAQEEEGDDAGSGREKFALELSVGVPVHWTNSPTPHKFFDAVADMDRTVTSNTAIGLALMWPGKKKIGFTIDSDFFFGTDVMGHSPTNSYSNSLFGANMLIAPVFYFYNGTFLRIPFAVGLHMYYWSSDHWLPSDLNFQTNDGVWVKTNDFQAGLGLYLGIQFHFNNNIYIFSRTNVALDMLRWHQFKFSDGTDIEKWGEFEFAMGWEIKPAIGIGIKF